MFGCFMFLMIVGLVIYLLSRGRRDRPEQLAAAKRPQSAGPVEAVTFASPHAKCSTCGAPGDQMKAQWDGLRKVAWTCTYCGAQAGVQELTDAELPPSARRRLGLGEPAAHAQDLGQGPYPPGAGMGGVGGLVTGVMLGSLMGGGVPSRGEGGSPLEGDWEAQASRGEADWSGNEGEDWGGGADSDWGDPGGDAGGDW